MGPNLEILVVLFGNYKLYLELMTSIHVHVYVLLKEKTLELC